jgi:competence protein ComEC
VASQFAAERDRWVLWAPAGFGVGIGCYFALPVEPPWLLSAIAPAVLLPLYMAHRWNRVGLVPLLALIVVLAGFAAAQIRTALIPDHMLKAAATGTLSGIVLKVKQRPGRPRVLIKQAELARGGAVMVLATARFSVGPSAALPGIGARIAVPVSLRPPPPPSAPGAHDFQRASFFHALSAVGYARGPIQVIAGAESAPVSATLWLARYRHDLSERIRAALPGVAGTLATALLTGERGPVPEPMLQAMRNAGLAHLLAISGLHMGLVAGIVFFGLRAGFALSGRLALHYPIKKWAAFGALVFAAGYLGLSGAAVPTQRAFLMTGLVLTAVLADRTAISMRMVAWAAMVVLLLRPDALLTASFQLSFAAVTALVATYEALAARRYPAFGSWEAAPGGVLRFIAGLLLTSLVANLATMPFGAYHFNRIACYGLLSNLLAVPLTGFWIMPWGVLALALAPLGLEALALTPMGRGLDILAAIAFEVASWPGATVGVAAWPPALPPVIGLAGLWLCLWRRRWRLVGSVVIVASISAAIMLPGPRIWFSGDGRLAAVRQGDNRLALSNSRRNRFAADLWARRAGGATLGVWRDEPEVFHCDGLGCVVRVEGATVAFSISGRALADDCRQAHILVSTAYRPAACDGPALILDRDRLWRDGGVAIWVDQGRIQALSVAGTRGVRPLTTGFPRRD